MGVKPAQELAAKAGGASGVAFGQPHPVSGGEAEPFVSFNGDDGTVVPDEPVSAEDNIVT